MSKRILTIAQEKLLNLVPLEPLIVFIKKQKQKHDGLKHLLINKTLRILPWTPPTLRTLPFSGSSYSWTLPTLGSFLSFLKSISSTLERDGGRGAGV